MPSAESLNLHPLYKDQNATHADLSLNDTNVNKLFNCLARTNTQVTTYDSGVGTGESLFQHLIAGAFGEGLVQKVKDGYTAIAKDYTPRDSIYIFGFSRGAYTARCLAGMIAICGLPTKGFEACVNTSDWPVCERQKEYMCTQLAKISVEFYRRDGPLL